MFKTFDSLLNFEKDLFFLSFETFSYVALISET